MVHLLPKYTYSSTYYGWLLWAYGRLGTTMGTIVAAGQVPLRRSLMLVLASATV